MRPTGATGCLTPIPPQLHRVFGSFSIALEFALTLPYSAACERNQGPILEILADVFADRSAVFEIGSGTGQHACHFARHLPHLTWQPADRAEWLPGLRARIKAEGTANIRPPTEFDVNQVEWPDDEFDAVFTANTLHIMSAQEVEMLFKGLSQWSESDLRLAIYGPFNYGGMFTSESNALFDADLRKRDPRSGIRDFEWVNALAAARGLVLRKDYSMPANNRLLVWLRR
jgi:hypothetical protein